MTLNRASVFWSWFVAHKHLYRDIEVPEKEQLLDDLLERLHAFCAQEVAHVEVCLAPSSPEGAGYRSLPSLREYLNGRTAKTNRR